MSEKCLTIWFYEPDSLVEARIGGSTCFVRTKRTTETTHCQGQGFCLKKISKKGYQVFPLCVKLIFDEADDLLLVRHSLKR